MKYNISDYRLKMEIEDGVLKYYENGSWKEIGGGNSNSVVFLIPRFDYFEEDQEKIKDYNKKVWQTLDAQTTNPIGVYLREWEHNVIANPSIRLRYCSNEEGTEFSQYDNRLGYGWLDYGVQNVTDEGFVYVSHIYRFYEDGKVAYVALDKYPKIGVDGRVVIPWIHGPWESSITGNTVNINYVTGNTYEIPLSLFNVNWTATINVVFDWRTGKLEFNLPEDYSPYKSVDLRLGTNLSELQFVGTCQTDDGSISMTLTYAG